MMSAYTIPLSPRRCVCCHRPAKVEVFNTYNASLGYHCVTCAKRVIAHHDAASNPVNCLQRSQRGQG